MRLCESTDHFLPRSSPCIVRSSAFKAGNASPPVSDPSPLLSCVSSKPNNGPPPLSISARSFSQTAKLTPSCLRRSNGSIKGSYSITLCPPPPCAAEPQVPDVDLTTSNGEIRARLTLYGKRPAHISAYTKNGAVRLHTQREGVVNINAETKNGAVYLWLPRGFDGIVTAHSGNGVVKLSRRAMEFAVIVPYPGLGQAWRVKVPKDADGGRRGSGAGSGGGGGGGGVRSASGGDTGSDGGTAGGNGASAGTGGGGTVDEKSPASTGSPKSSTSPSSAYASLVAPGGDKKSLALAIATDPQNQADTEDEHRLAREARDAAQARDRAQIDELLRSCRLVSEEHEIEDERLRRDGAREGRQGGRMEDGKAGPDRADARTANGKVTVYLEDEEEGEGSRCAVM